MRTDWPVEETEAANSGETTKHLWEESWDDDDTSDDFSQQLKYAAPPPSFLLRLDVGLIDKSIHLLPIAPYQCSRQKRTERGRR